MNAMPPEPDGPVPGFPVQPFPVQGSMGGQPGPPPGRQRLVSRLPVWQIVVSLIKPALWTGAAAIILVGMVLELTIDNVGGAVVCLIVGGYAAWMSYRSCRRWGRRFLG